MIVQESKLVRERLSMTLSKECIERLNRQVESRKYYNRSRAIEVLILKDVEKGS